MERTDRDGMYMETAVPAAGRIDSRALLAAALLCCAVIVQQLRRAYGQMLPFSPLWIQLPLYAALFLWAAWVLRRRLTAYRYTLTDESLTVERLSGDRAVVLLRMRREDIRPDAVPTRRTVYAFTGKRAAAGVLYGTADGRAVKLLHSMSAEMRALLGHGGV